MTAPVFDADGIVLEVGDTVAFQIFDGDNGDQCGVGDVIEINGHEVFISEQGNGGAEGWVKSDCVRLYV